MILQRDRETGMKGWIGGVGKREGVRGGREGVGERGE